MDQPKKRGRPPKQLVFPSMEVEEKSDVRENVKVATEYRIKHIIRAISKTGLPMQGGQIEPLPQVEAYISSFMDQGYKLAYTVMLGQDPEMINMLYILTKDAL
jgi:hypothetical protein